MKKKIRFPLQLKTMLIIVVMAALLSGIAVLTSQRVFAARNDNTFRQEATELAKTISAVVDPADVADLQQAVAAIYDAAEVRVGSEGMGTPAYDAYIRLYEGITERESYRSLYGVLRGIQEANTVESVYLLYVDVPTRATVYLVDASDEPCPPGNFDPVYEQNFAVLSDPEVGFPAYITNTPEYGWLVSAAVPVHDAQGNAAAYAFTDISMNAVKQSERNFLFSLLGILLVLTLIVSVTGILVVNRAIVRPVNQLSNAAIRYYDEESRGKDNFAELEIHTGDEIENLSQAMKQMEQDMNAYIRDLTAVTAEKERIGAELNIATQIQADMLPRIFPPFPDRTEFDIYATMDPAKEVGGDFYDFFLLDDNHLGLVMADVSGKGVPAALFMVIAKTMIKNRAQMGGGPAEVLSYVNDQLCEGNEAELFVTVWFAILDLSTGQGMAANAGHEHPVIRRAGGNYELVVYRHSPAVATMEGMRFREHSFELHPGDSLFVYTDGVPEATDANNELFGNDRMLAALNQDPAAEPEQILRNVRRSLDAFVGDAPQFDDITMLGLVYRGVKEMNSRELTLEASDENLQEAMAFVDEQLEEMDCPIKVQMQIDVAVEELFVNVAHYAYAPGTGPVTLRTETQDSPRAISITFTDRGVPYDPLAKPDPDVTLSAEERQIGGLGIYMVKKTMTDMRYRYEEGRNILTICKEW